MRKCGVSAHVYQMGQVVLRGDDADSARQSTVAYNFMCVFR